VFDALREALTQAHRADRVLNLLLDYCTRLVSHAIIAAVQQQRLRAYSARGYYHGIGDMRTPLIQPRADGYLSHVCQGQTYYQGPVQDPELMPWFFELGGAQPVDVLIIPICLGARTPLLVILDDGDEPISENVLSQVFPAIHQVAARLEQLLTSSGGVVDTGSVATLTLQEQAPHQTPTRQEQTLHQTPTRPVSTVHINRDAPTAERMTRQPITDAEPGHNPWGGLWTRPRVQRPPAAAEPSPAPHVEESSDLDIVVDVDDTHWSPPSDSRRLYLSQFGREVTPHRAKRPDVIALKAAQAAPTQPAPTQAAPTQPAPTQAAQRHERESMERESIERPPTTRARPPFKTQSGLASFDNRSTSAGLMDLTDDIEPLDFIDDDEALTTMEAPAPEVEIDFEYWVERLDHTDPATAERAFSLLTRPDPQARSALLAAFPGRLLIDRFKFDRDMPPASQHSALLAALLVHAPFVARTLIHQTLDRGLDDCFYSLLFFLESGDPSVLPHLYKHIFSRDPQIRQTALRLLRRHRQDPVAGELCTALRQNLDSTQLRLIELSLQALASLREASAIPDILRCLDHANARISESAHSTLCAITLDDPGATLARWTRWVQVNPPPYSRHFLVARALLHADRAIRHLAAEELYDLTSPPIPYHPDDARADRQIAADLLLQRFQR
jgi:hypothetical protein